MITLYVVAQDDNARAIADALGKGPAAEIDKRASALVSKVARHIKDRAPSRSGALKKSISKRKVGTLEYAVQETGISYGPYQRYGTVAHYIFPRKGGWLMSYDNHPPNKSPLRHPLRFVGPPLTKLHPGPKPTHYVEYGLLDARDKIQYFINSLPETIYLGIKGRGLAGYSTKAPGFNQWQE